VLHVVREGAITGMCELKAAVEWSAGMETIWDWLTIFIFAGLVTLLLQRSSEDSPKDKLWQYFPAALACAVANYLGNHGVVWAAVAILVGLAVYMLVVLKVRLPRA
jgi:hypothetical protein